MVLTGGVDVVMVVAVVMLVVGVEVVNVAVVVAVPVVVGVVVWLVTGGLLSLLLCTSSLGTHLSLWPFTRL